MKLYNRYGKAEDWNLVPIEEARESKWIDWDSLKTLFTEGYSDTLIPLPDEEIILLSSTQGAGKGTKMGFHIYPEPSNTSLYGKGKRPCINKTFYPRRGMFTLARVPQY